MMMINSCSQVDLTEICMNDDFHSVETHGVIKCLQSFDEKSICKLCARLVFNVSAEEWPDH